MTKLRANIAERVGAMAREGFAPLEIKQDHFVALTTVPTHHRDPLDHLLIAQAMCEDAVFVSADRHASLYPVS